MNKHYGQIVEKVIRRDGYSISELARLMNVNRRSIYNWFNKKRLKTEVIYRIGGVLSYDFSKEFPELFRTNEFEYLANNPETSSDNDEQQAEQAPTDHWKDKYITLLEKYNELLSQNMEAQNKK
ncbi:TetR/AcrR family transcriptional regulator [Mucilaginibacter sp. Bleaf8]|uniref:helix-turn-helix domain-containing protein n=1 Tax=Mucilaginibacter sp. Bleaf8 TaxID=2834430 RepID=UPI001BCA8657|nr:helix-turn-helix domain-containing protein [Mucilaginibacter sp. Bleaf8]MBS7566826.1 TetR/AcrR family transcriptional regulator [Mucilaginibacter sp. Bleaf8]